MKRCTECGVELKSNNKKVLGMVLVVMLLAIVGVVVFLTSKITEKVDTLRDSITWEEDEEKVNDKVEEFKETNIEQYGNRTIDQVFIEKDVKKWKVAQDGEVNYVSVTYVELETEFEVLINVTKMEIVEYYIGNEICEETRMMNLVEEIVHNLDLEVQLAEMKVEAEAAVKAEAEAKAKAEAESKEKEEAEAKAKEEAEAKAKEEAEKFIGKNGQYGSNGATLNVEVSDKTITTNISVDGYSETMKGKVLANNKAVVYLEAGEAITLNWKDSTTIQVTADNGFYDESIAFIRMICEALNNQEYRYK